VLQLVHFSSCSSGLDPYGGKEKKGKKKKEEKPTLTSHLASKNMVSQV
jgi:hypothetical protein